MSTTADFLRLLLREGRAVLREPPHPANPRDTAVAGLLEQAYANFRLQVAGPAVPFDGPTALAAASLVHHACWFLLSRAEPGPGLERSLAMPARPRSPAQHLSADLLLRYLPPVHRRARALDPADRLTTTLAAILREWPLSGVLSDVREEPVTAPDFDGHPGLGLLYAERLIQNPKAAWLPAGPGLELLEVAGRELGQDVSHLLRQTRPVVRLESADEGGRGDE